MKRGMTTKVWIDTFHDLKANARTHVERDLADMAATILDLAGETDELVDYLGNKTLEALEWREQYKGDR